METLARRDDHLGEAFGAALVGEHLVEVLVERFRVDPERKARVGLRVEVDDQHARAVVREAAGEIHRGGGLRAASLLVDDGDGAHG